MRTLLPTVLALSLFPLARAYAQQAPAGALAVTIDYAHPQQTIAGFGFSTAWGNLPGDANNDAFFSVTKGAGFSILRNRIPFRDRAAIKDDHFIVKHDGRYVFTTHTDADGAYKTFELEWDANFDLAKTHKLLAAVGTHPDYHLDKIFSTPWTPPNNEYDRWKLPTPASSKHKNRLTEASYATTPDVGGYLDPAHYQDYADALADYCLGFQTHMGHELYALSLQNEPGFDCSYESCDWDAEQFHDFLPVLYKEFTRKGVWQTCPNLKIMAPEDDNFRDTLLSKVYADPKTRDLVQIAAGHQYEYGPWNIAHDFSRLFTARDAYHPNPFTASRDRHKPVWMTEWSLDAFRQAPPMTQALILAQVVHQDVTRSRLNAFVFWWSSALLERQPGQAPGGPSKNLWSLAQYSRFVRPGWQALPTNTPDVPGIYLTAFADPQMHHFALVAVNATSADQPVTLTLDGAALQSLHPYRTAAAENLAALAAIPVNATQATVTLAPGSITTYEGIVTP